MQQDRGARSDKHFSCPLLIGDKGGGGGKVSFNINEAKIYAKLNIFRGKLLVCLIVDSASQYEAII